MVGMHGVESSGPDDADQLPAQPDVVRVAGPRLGQQFAALPGDFMFLLNAAEKAEVVANCDHLAKLKFSKVLPHAFTEHGAIQAANVLASPQPVEMGIFVVRAFVRMRELASVHADLAKRLS